MNKKICILTDSLGFGGAEKVAANMSISLRNRGYHVIVVSMLNIIDYPYAGTLFNFGLIKEKNNKLTALLKFKGFFKTQKFDVVIDHRTRNSYFKELLLSKWILPKTKVFYCVHNYMLDYYFSFTKLPWLARLPHVKKNFFVCVSNDIKNYLKRKLNINSVTIYNYLDLKSISCNLPINKKQPKNYIIAVGRLTKIKQFDVLIRSYNNSDLLKNEITLIILGDGKEKDNLELLITELKLGNFVKLLPFTKEPYGLIENAKALVLTSKVEGFGMVLLEALSLNTPVIAYNCKSGPNEIIINEKNGLLVENQNEEQLTLALNKLLLDDTYYSKIKANTHIGLEKFSEEKIIQEWISLLENQM